MIKYKIVIALIGICFSFLHCVGQNDRITYELNKKNDSLTGFFYIYVGIFDKGIFYRDAIQLRSISDGFYFSDNGVFLTDTMYSFIDESSYYFKNMMDSLKNDHQSYQYTFFPYDSLKNIYFNSQNKSFKKIKRRYKNQNPSLFLKIKMTVYYNNSYIKDNDIPFKYSFNSKGELASPPLNKKLYYKPILYFKILTPPKFSIKPFFWERKKE